MTCRSGRQTAVKTFPAAHLQYVVPPAAEILASKLQPRPQPAAAGRAQLDLHHALIERTQPAMVQQQQESLVPMGGQVEIHPRSVSQKEISDSID